MGSLVRDEGNWDGYAWGYKTRIFRSVFLGCVLLLMINLGHCFCFFFLLALAIYQVRLARWLE